MGITTNGIPAAAAHGNRTVAVVTLQTGGLAWTSWEYGEGAGPWTRIDAPVTSVAPAVSFNTSEGGVSVWLGVTAVGTKQVYENRQSPDGSFGEEWTLIPGVETDVSPAVSDGNLVIGYPIMVALARPPDGRSFINTSLGDQPPDTPPPGYWKPIEPSPGTALAPALAVVDLQGAYMFLAATVVSFTGPNSHLELFQGNILTPDQVSVAGLNFETNISPAMASANNRTVLVAVDPDGVIFYNWWDAGGGGHDWISLQDDVKTDGAPAVALVDNGNYMFVLARGMDGELYMNQGEVGGSTVGWNPAERYTGTST